MYINAAAVVVVVMVIVVVGNQLLRTRVLEMNDVRHVDDLNI